MPGSTSRDAQHSALSARARKQCLCKTAQQWRIKRLYHYHQVPLGGHNIIIPRDPQNNNIDPESAEPQDLSPALTCRPLSHVSAEEPKPALTSCRHEQPGLHQSYPSQLSVPDKNLEYYSAMKALLENHCSSTRTILLSL